MIKFMNNEQLEALFSVLIGLVIGGVYGLFGQRVTKALKSHAYHGHDKVCGRCRKEFGQGQHYFAVGG